jgi:hypothetical protein
MHVAKPRANSGDPSGTIELEQELLRNICRDDLRRADLDRAFDMLASYSWQQPEHATVFKAIRRVSRSESGGWRHELPAQTTRMGFPDVDWSIYLSPPNENGATVDELVERLIDNRQ